MENEKWDENELSMENRSDNKKGKEMNTLCSTVPKDWGNGATKENTTARKKFKITLAKLFGINFDEQSEKAKSIMLRCETRGKLLD